MPPIRGVVFDKDGTLFDFNATWSAWAAGFLTALAEGDAAVAGRLGAAIGFDLAARVFVPGSPVIAGTPDDIAEVLAPHIPEVAPEALVARMNAAAAGTVTVPAADLAAVLGDLRARGLRIGLATNDAEVSARSHLSGAGVLHLFDFVAGSDSGHGGKPAPGMLLAFAAQMRLSPEEVAMVGDSTHDLHAARAAGMRAVAVLTGPARHEDLAPHADVVLPDIGHLSGWLAVGQGSAT